LLEMRPLTRQTVMLFLSALLNQQHRRLQVGFF
jgi:hypothetical protein